MKKVIIKDVSFVLPGEYTQLEKRQELVDILKKCRNSKTNKFERYDLSLLEDLSGLDFSGMEMSDIVFHRFDRKRMDRKLIFDTTFQGCRMTRVSFAQCKLERCNFDRDIDKKGKQQKRKTSEPRLAKVDFFFSELSYCRFKNVKMVIADFRYAILDNCSLGFLDISYGDFYMTAFKGCTNFPDAKFRLCSISHAIFEQQCLTMDNIDRLAQEKYTTYKNIIIRYKTWNKQNPCATKTNLNKSEAEPEPTKIDILTSKKYIAREAMQTYAQLSGLYNGKGLFKDSNKAYEKSKRCEAKYYWFSLREGYAKGDSCSVVKNIWNLLNPVFARLFGYGFKVWPLLAWAVVIILLFWFVLVNIDTTVASAEKSFVISVANTMSPLIDKDAIAENIQKFTVFESVLGVLFVGFIGFVFANKIRNNS